MNIQVKIKTSAYYDSVTLMAAARELLKVAGVEDASIVMGTQSNKDLLKQNNLYAKEMDSATPNDLIIAVRGGGEAALAEAEKLLSKKAPTSGGGSAYQPKSIRSAVKAQPDANLAVISVAGRYAADEAWEALHQGLHVLLFSDNVSLEDEIALKKYAGAARPAADGSGSRHGHPERCGLGLCQCAAAGAGGHRLGRRHRAAGGEHPAGQARGGHHPGHRHRRARPERRGGRD